MWLVSVVLLSPSHEALNRLEMERQNGKQIPSVFGIIKLESVQLTFIEHYYLIIYTYYIKAQGCAAHFSICQENYSVRHGSCCRC